MNPVLALIIVNIIWGAAFPIFKFALLNIPPFTLAFIRFFFAGLIFIPLVVRKWQKLTLQQWRDLLIFSFFGITINISTFFLGIKRTDSINAAVIACSGPIFIYFFSLIFLGEKAKLRVFFGMIGALMGVLLIIFAPIFKDGQRLVLGQIEGNALVLIATLGAVIQTVIGNKMLKTINSYQALVVSFLFGAVTFLPFMLGELQRWSFSELNIQGVSGIVFGIFLSSALAYYLFYNAVAKIEGQEVGIFTYIDPVVAVILAIPLLNEYPNIYFYLGSILVFGGIYVAEKRIHWHPFHKLKNQSLKLSPTLEFRKESKTTT